ncbi:MAG: macrolide transporter [Paenibacillus sp.]|nr:macrolide transporter [Paenibacillus sp.]
MEENIRIDFQRTNLFNFNVRYGSVFNYLAFDRDNRFGCRAALLGPFIGVWLDRWNRKLTMMVADSVIAFSSLVMGAWFLWGDPSLWVVYAILFIRSAATSFHAPSFQAVIPLIAPEEQLTKVAGWHQLVFSASTVLGPALGIAVYSATSLGLVLLLDVAGALLANFMLLLVKIHQPKQKAVQAP